MDRKFKPLAVEREIAEEMASSLGRIGSEFSKRQGRAWSAWRAWERGRGLGDERGKRLRSALQSAMDEAERYRFAISSSCKERRWGCETTRK